MVFGWLIDTAKKIGEGIVSAIDKGLEIISGGRIDLIKDEPKKEEHKEPKSSSNIVAYEVKSGDKTYVVTVDYSTNEVKYYEKTPEGLKETSIPSISGTIQATYEVEQKGSTYEFKPISKDISTIRDPYVRKVVEETLSSDVGESVIRAIPIVGQIYHAYETYEATRKLKEYLKEHPEAYQDVLKAGEILRSEKTKQLGVDTAVHTASLLTAGALSSLGIASSIAGRSTGSVGLKMVTQGAIEGATIGAVADVTRQTAETVLGIRNKYDPKETLLSIGLGAGIGSIFRGGQYLLAKRLNKPEWIADKIAIKDVNIDEIKVKNIQTPTGIKSFANVRGTASVDYLVRTKKGDIVVASRNLPFTQTSTVETIASKTTETAGITKNIIKGSAHIGKYSYKFEGTGYEMGLYTHKEIPLTNIAENIRQNLAKTIPKFKELSHPHEYISRAVDIYGKTSIIKVRSPIAQTTFKGDVVEDISKLFVSKMGGVIRPVYGDATKGSSVIIGKYDITIKGLGKPITTAVEHLNIRSGYGSVQFVKGLGHAGKEFVGITSLYGRPGLQIGSGRYVDPKVVSQQIAKTFEKIKQFGKLKPVSPNQPSHIIITTPKFVNPVRPIIPGLTGIVTETSKRILESIQQSIQKVTTIPITPSKSPTVIPTTPRPPEVVPKTETEQTEQIPPQKPSPPEETSKTSEVGSLPKPEQPTPPSTPSTLPTQPTQPITPPTPPMIPFPFVDIDIQLGTKLSKETAKIVNELVYTLSRLRL